VHASERQLHLGLHASNLRNPETGSLPCGVPQERGLAHAGLPTEHQRGAVARTHASQELVEVFPLALPIHEFGRTGGGGHLAAR